MSTPEHRHTFRPATVALPSGRTQGARCHCGVEVVGPETQRMRLNAEVVRVGENFNRALGEGLAELARRMQDPRR